MMWFEYSGIKTSTRTPRRAAAIRAANTSRSGMKYAVVIITWSVARSIASMYMPRIG